MRFRSILDLFKQDNWSNELVQMTTEMLELASAMFSHTSAVIVAGGADDDPQVNIYDRDKRINKLERKIRRRVVSRLSVGDSKADVPTALIFMNVVKDGERLGDYIKNLHEVAEMMPAEPDRELYRQWLAEPTETIARLFDQTRRGFVDTDEALAGAVIKTAKSTGRDVERRIREITASGLATRDAVCLVLVLRFYKRLVAHMSNIASTVVMPLDLIDFYDEPEG
ncbi:MAG: PhoU domain-containing protein [bacterium]|nr:PhoU domain-containing protein [bacterium]